MSEKGKRKGGRGGPQTTDPHRHGCAGERGLGVEGGMELEERGRGGGNLRLRRGSARG